MERCYKCKDSTTPCSDCVNKYYNPHHFHIDYSNSPDKTVKTCPVCYGRGFMPDGFYRSTGDAFLSNGLGHETCRSCNGLGYVVI